MPPDPPPAPTDADVLHWCAAGVWFPADQPDAPRPLLDQVVWRLRQTGRIEVADWVQGRGQGFRLTPAGRLVFDPTVATGAVDLFDAPPPPADRGDLTREAFLAPGPAFVTPAVLVVCCVWFLVGIAGVWWYGEPVGRAVAEMPADGLLKLGAVYGPRLFAGEWWRLVTAGFVHTSGLHLLGNLFALALLGPVAEWLWGRWRFVALFVLCGAAAAAATVGLNPAVVVCGASGAAWGVLCAVIAWLLRYRHHLPPSVLAEWGRRLTWVAAANALVSLLPGSAWEGHLAGGVCGVIAGGLLDRTRMGGRRRVLLAGLGLGVLVLAVGGLLAGMARYSPDWQPVRDAADPAKQDAELRAVVTALDPAAVGAAVAALPDRDPAKRLKAIAASALDKVPDAPGPAGRFRSYAAAVGRLADEMLDPHADPADLRERHRQIAKRWRTLADGR